MELASSFEADVRESLLDTAEMELAGTSDNLIFQTIQQAHETLRAYGQRNDYDVEPIIDSLGTPDVTRTQSDLRIRWGWEHPAAPMMEFGTAPHHIDGNPVLSFVWEDPPQWVREEFDQARSTSGQFEQGWRVFLPEVDVAGLPESRFVREAIRWLRTHLED